MDITLLTKLPLFAGLEAQALDDIAHAAEIRVIEKDKTVFEQGATADTLYILLSGRVKVSQITIDGHQVVMKFMGAGDMVGGLAVFARTPFPASAATVADSGFAMWDAPTIFRLMERHPHIAINALALLGRRLQEMHGNYRELAFERVERRIAHAVLRLARQAGKKVEDGIEIDFQISRQDIAEMTGTTLHTVSRIISGWEHKGLLVEGGRQRVVIRQPHALVAIAEDL